MRITDPTESPDQNAAGLLQSVPDPLRYDIDHPADPDEVHGIIADMIPATAKVLDVGCGSGAVMKILQDVSHAEFLGIEPDVTRAARASARGLTVRAGYLTPETVREIGLFDIVLFADVLEHLPNPQVMLVARPASAETRRRGDRFRAQCGALVRTSLPSPRNVPVSAGRNNGRHASQVVHSGKHKVAAYFVGIQRRPISRHSRPMAVR